MVTNPVADTPHAQCGEIRELEELDNVTSPKLLLNIEFLIILCERLCALHER